MPPEQDSPQPPISQVALDSFGKFLANQGPGKESGMDFVGRMASSYAAGKDPFAEEQTPQQQEAQPTPPPRSFSGDLGASVMRGLYAIPETWAKAYEGVGRAAKDFAGIDLPGTQTAGDSAVSIGKSKDEAWAPPQSAQNSGTRNAITQGVESATTSLAPALAGSGAGAVLGSVVPGIGTALGAGVGGLIGLFSGVPSFAAAQYRDTMKQAEEKGVDPSTARWAALTNAASEGGTELLSDVVAAATGGTGKVLTSVGKEALKAGISPLLKQSWKPVLANMGKVFGAEASTELLNQGIQAEANKAAGIDDKSFWDAIAENAGPVGVASLIFSTVGGGLTMAGRRRVENALTNPDIHPAEREAAVKTVTNHLENIDPDAAKVWNSAANDALSNGQAIPLDEDFMGKAQIGQEAENISRAAQPSDRPIGGILQAAGLEGKPEWQQALATFDSLTEGQNAITRAMPSAGNGEQALIPELKKGGNNGGDDSQNASADQALGPALERAWYDPGQVEAGYQKRLEQARQAGVEPFPASMGETLGEPAAGVTPEVEPVAIPGPRQLSAAEQKQASDLQRKIGNLDSLLLYEKNIPARTKIEETKRDYVFRLRDLIGENAPVMTPEEQARSLAVSTGADPQAQALPVGGQNFELVGETIPRPPVSDAEAASMEPFARESAVPVEMPTVKDLEDYDAGKGITEEQAVRQYQEQVKRASETEYGKSLSPLWDFLRGRVDAKSISDHYGKAVLENLRGKAPRDLFRSRANGGVGWDKLEQEAKSQGLIAPDADLLDVLQSNVTNKEQSQRDRVNGVNEVWQREELPVGSDMPAPEDVGMVPVNSDGTVRYGQGPMYRQGQPGARGLVLPDVQAAIASTPYSGVEVLNSPEELADSGLLDELRRTGNLGSKGAYNPRTGKAYIFAGNHENVADAIQTARDELFHRGTFRWAEQQAQANPKAGPAFKQLNGFMAQVRYARRDDINAWLDENGYGELKNTNYGAAEWLTHEASKQAPKWHDRYVAALVEFFRKMGNALGINFKMTGAEIRNWSQQVESGMGEETGLRGMNPTPLEQRTYQGSPTRGIERMDDAYLGTGEGGRRETENDYSGAYGWGHYSAQKRGTAEWYRKNLSVGPDNHYDAAFELISGGHEGDLIHESESRKISGQEIKDRLVDEENLVSADSRGEHRAMSKMMGIIDQLDADKFSLDPKANYLRRILYEGKPLEDVINERANKGQLYQLEVPDSDKLLDWDKPLSEQPKDVKEKLEANVVLPDSAIYKGGFPTKEELVSTSTGDEMVFDAKGNLKPGLEVRQGTDGLWNIYETKSETGREIYEALVEAKGSAKAASQYLESIGIPGHQYLDASSRGEGEGTHNIVTYSGKNIDITGTFYRKPTPQATVSQPGAKASEDREKYGIAFDTKPSGTWDKEGVKAKLTDLYDKFVNADQPWVRWAGVAGPDAAKAMDARTGRVRGVGGIVNEGLAGAKVPTFWKTGDEAGKSGTKAFSSVLSQISSEAEYRNYEVLRKGERMLALAKYRPEFTPERAAEMKAAIADIRQAYGNSPSPKEIVQMKSLIKDTQDYYRNGVKGVDAALWSKNLAELKQAIGPDEYARLQNISGEHRQWERDAILKPLLKSGIMSQEKYDAITKAPESEYYSSFQREMDNVDRQVIGSKQIIKRLVGSEHHTIPSTESTIANFTRTVRLVEENARNRQFVGLRELSEDLAEVIRPVKANPEHPPRDALMVYEGGAKKYYTVPKDILKAAQSMNPQDTSLAMKILAAPARALRAGSTLTLEFMARNPIRDQMSAYLFSRYGYMPVRDFIKGISAIAGKSELYREYRASGAEQAYFTALDRQFAGKTAKELMGYGDQGAIKYLKNPLEALRWLNEWSEKGTRVGAYVNSREKGATSMQAMQESRDLTIDFARMGSQGKALNQIIAFWNASVQDADKLSRSFKESPGQTMTRITLGITLPSLILWAINKDEEWYKELPEWRKNLFWNFRFGDGPVLSLPKPFGPGMLFGSLPERFLDFVVNNDKKALPNAFKDTLGAFSPGAIPTAALPVLEWMTNYSFFRQAPLENAGMQNLPAGYRANSGTSKALAEFGKLTDISPVKLENTIRGVFGGLGKMGLDLIADPATNAITGNSVPEVGKHWYEAAPLVKGFVARDPIGSGSKSVEDFYDNYKEAEETRFAYRSLLKSGDKQAAEKYFSANRDAILMAGQMSETAKGMSKLRQSITAIQRDPAMSSDEKRRRNRSQGLDNF